MDPKKEGNDQSGNFMDKLYSAYQLGELTLKNRLFALPVFTGYGLPDSRVSPLMLEHYRRLARSGAAVITIPNVSVSENGRTSERSLLANDDRHITGLNRLATRIQQEDALACFQLNHSGRYAVTDRPMLPSALEASDITGSVSNLKNFMESFPFWRRFELTKRLATMSTGWLSEMTEGDIQKVISDFGDAAERGVQSGYDMIELHGATGYLIAQFLSPETNRRDAPWGGSEENRWRFPLAILEEVKSRVPKGYPVGFRLILDEKTRKGITINEALNFARKLEENGIAYLSATVGTYQSMFNPEIVKELSKAGYLMSLTKALKDRVKVPVIISGRVVSPAIAEKIFKNKAADLIGLGRPLLADPDWISKAKRQEKITRCKNCNSCFKHVALGEGAICDRWLKVDQDRVRLENRFTSRGSYRTLIVLSCRSDLEIARAHIERRIPITEDIFDRLLYIDTGEDKGFMGAAREFAAWSEQALRSQVKRSIAETVFIENVVDPEELILEHLKQGFGYLSVMRNENSEWKKRITRNAPSDVVVALNGAHQNLKKVMIPCDLSTFTLMQLRVTQHLYLGRENVVFRFCHVTESRDKALRKWSEITSDYRMFKTSSLDIITPAKGVSVANTLIQEIVDGDFGQLIMARRGGLTRVRRRLMGSVSERLLNDLPDLSVAIIG